MRSFPGLRSAAGLALLLAAAWLPGCAGPRYERDTFYESGDTEIVLRTRTDAPVRYDHPASVSSVRMAHILASLDVRFEDQEKKNARTPAIPVELVYPVGELVSRALAAAKPEQEILVMAQRRERTLKLFTERRLTSFIVFMEDGQLHIHFGHVDWPMPKNPNERVREPRLDKELMEFKVLPGKSIVPVGRQEVAVDWRDPGFRRADSIRLGPGGAVTRRTVLMEEPEAEAPEAPPGDVIDLSTLTPDALRKLADLEDERRRGEIDEAEYLARRREILEQGTR